MAHWVRKVVKHTLIVKAVGVGVVALVVGGSHLLLRQLPEHQAELSAHTPSPFLPWQLAQVT